MEERREESRRMDDKEMYLKSLLEVAANNTEMAQKHTFRFDKLEGILSNLDVEIKKLQSLAERNQEKLAEINNLLQHTTNKQLSEEIIKIKDNQIIVNTAIVHLTDIATQLRTFNDSRVQSDTLYNERINTIMNILNEITEAVESTKSSVVELSKKESGLKVFATAIVITLTLIAGVVTFVSTIMQEQAIEKTIERVIKEGSQ